MDGIKPKLDRAAQLIAEIELAAEKFVDTLPPLRIEGGYRPGSSTYAFRAFGSSAAPVIFSVMAGEVVYLQRSALDHVVTKLVMQDGGMESRRNQFPICRTQDEFDKCVSRGFLDGVSSSGKDAILRMQPFNSPGLDDSALLALAEMNNTDKHRLLLTTVTAARLGNEVRIGGNTFGGKINVTGMSPPFSHQITETGAEFFSIDFAEVYDGIEIAVDVKRTISVQRPASLRWKFECAPLQAVLTQIQQLIEGSIRWQLDRP